MARKPRLHYTAELRSRIWDKYEQGESLWSIARSIDRSSSCIYGLLAPTGGVRPPDRKRAKLALSLAEREEISRGIVANLSIRTIATQLGRSPSTVSREINRHGGYADYRAAQADKRAWDNALRPKVSVFNGPSPVIKAFDTQDEEMRAVAALKERMAEGVAAHEIGIFVRSSKEMPRAQAAMKLAGLPYKVLDEHVEVTAGFASAGTMHLAKGLEFRAVAVMACDDEVIPLQERIETVADNADLEEVYNTERHLLYVACTRARDILLVTSVEPASECLSDMLMQ